MLSEKDVVRIGKYLSLVLRHQPGALGIVLDGGGWTDVAVLLEKLRTKGFGIDMETLRHVVDANSKKRFSFSHDQTKIRANQGHSVSVNLALPAVAPPEVLYHGTGQKSVAAILQQGLHKKSRQHVHLSSDEQTAISVGRRHGRPVVFRIAAATMQENGFLFFVSQNGVWLTDHVPAKYLAVVP